MTSTLEDTGAFGGGRLASWNVTRFVHMDEAGIAHHDPHCVEAGVIIHADRQWKELEWQVLQLRQRLVPQEYRRDFVFHAKDIFNGGCKYFSRERFPNPLDRAKVVASVASLTTDHALPIALGCIPRADFIPLDGSNRHQVSVQIHGMAYAACIGQIEHWMQGYAPDEVAVLYVENNSSSRQMLKEVHEVFSNPELAGYLPPAYYRTTPLTHIVENPAFAEKAESSLLQIADACAFSVARCLKKGSLWEVLYDAVKPSVISWPYFFEAERSAP